MAMISPLATGAPSDPESLGRDDRRLARTLRGITLTFIVTTTITIVLALTASRQPPSTYSLAMLGTVMAVLWACLVLIRRDHLRASSWLLVGIVWSFTTLGLVGAGGLDNPVYSFYAVGIVAAGLLLGARAAIAMALVSGVTGGVLGLLQARGVFAEPVHVYQLPGVYWVELILFTAVAALVSISIGRIRDSMREAEASRAELALRNRDLEETLAEVERAQEIQADLEAKLAQSQRLEALGRLAGGVAHDFNNLLVVIQGYAELIQHAPAGDAELREAAGQIRAASKQAAKLTSQLLAFSRKQVQHRVVLDLNELVSRSHDMLRRLVRENVEIVTDLERGLPAIKSDEGQLNQVLMNLVANARDALPHGGRIGISTRTSRRSTGDSDLSVVLRIEDDGDGMSDETRRQIFDPFFTTKGLANGTGLGLASVYGIVEQCHGTIDVASEIGRGTVFTITLPATTDHVERAGATTARGATRSDLSRILLVEDHAPVRRIFARVLSSEGHEVIEAADGVEALERVADLAEPVDLLLTDVMMPRMDGPTLATELRARWPKLRVLYTTGYSPDDLSEMIDDDPFADLLPKPFSEPEVRSKVEALLATAPD